MNALVAIVVLAFYGPAAILIGAVDVVKALIDGIVSLVERLLRL